MHIKSTCSWTLIEHIQYPLFHPTVLIQMELRPSLVSSAAYSRMAVTEAVAVILGRLHLT
jgi:hypothetical protein